jgi:hypothetical protein
LFGCETFKKVMLLFIVIFLMFSWLVAQNNKYYMQIFVKKMMRYGVLSTTSRRFARILGLN